MSLINPPFFQVHGGFKEAAKIGSDVVTAPPKAIWQMLQHPLTDKGLKAFLEDWEKTGQKLGQVG